MRDGLMIHLIGLTESEATGSLAEHGEQTHCMTADCEAPSVMMLIFKKPGSAWGQNVTSTAACSRHRKELEQIISRVTRGVHGEA